MSVDFHWFLPTYGDGRNIVNNLKVVPGSGSLHAKLRQSDPYYLVQIARAAEGAGFKGVLLPTGFSAEDTFVTAGLVAPHTRTLEYIIAFRAGLTLPAIAAQMTGTLQRATGNRIHLNITSGGSPADQRAYGDFLDHDDRYRRTDDFLSVLHQLWSGAPFTHEGPFYRSEVAQPGSFGAKPVVHFTGSSEIAKDIAARQADVYLMYGEPPPVLAQRVKEMRERAAAYGRTLRFGLFMHVIARETEEAAFAEAQRHLDTMDAESVARVQSNLRAMDSEGQARLFQLHHGRVGGVKDLIVYPNIWAGVGLIRGGGGTALLGSHAQVAERLEEYVDAGLETIILNGYPALEEAYRVGELILPLVRRSRAAAASAA
ncbi:LLM class flavin-dependent oxidoreductase [Xanthobacter autotrophicus DSM 431]|uniref:LLM class flavin-dependent oxidoreductase n=1 Tax=Xanthobacter nonsaccharivorans TaxID=3119912 RepID=UPI0037268D91